MQKPLTKRTIQNILRKAGHTKSEYHRSGMVRGWGEWTEGYKVEESDGQFRVSYNVDRFWARREPERATDDQRRRAEEYQRTLEKAGVSSTLVGEAVPHLEIYVETHTGL
jgi:hypothetical protein